MISVQLGPNPNFQCPHCERIFMLDKSIPDEEFPFDQPYNESDAILVAEAYSKAFNRAAWENMIMKHHLHQIHLQTSNCRDPKVIDEFLESFQKKYERNLQCLWKKSQVG